MTVNNFINFVSKIPNQFKIPQSKYHQYSQLSMRLAKDQRGISMFVYDLKNSYQ